MKWLYLFIGSLTSCFGWWDIGHLLIAEVARQELDPCVVERVEKILSYFAEDFPESSTFVTAACFADDFANEGPSSKLWHCILTPYDPEGILSEETLAMWQYLSGTTNIVDGIHQCVTTLKNGRTWEQCYAMRMLMHLVGDIHQPLHCIERYSTEFPQGDRAAHRFQLDGDYPTLHALWDSVFGIHPKRIPRPLNSQDQEWLVSMATTIRENIPIASSEMDPAMWSEESYRIAIEVAYRGIDPNTHPNQDYWANGQSAALNQIALAGYRLARLIESLEFCAE